MKNNKYEIDMCNGTIMDKLISFAFPLMLSGILQLMFNAVDIIVVGRFSGSQALAAVGSTTALINVFVNLFIGISLGANVLAARFYAAGREEEMSQTVHTAITLALISGVVMAFVGVLFAKGALELMGTPDDVISQSTLYMRIYFMGMPFFMLYNYGAAILRAVGDTKRPHFRLYQCGIKPDPGDWIPSGCCRGCNRNDHFPVCVLYPCFALPLQDAGQLPASFFKAVHQWCLSETDFSGWDSGRNSEYSDQLFERTVTVVRQLFWCDGDGGVYGSQ